MTNRSHHLQPAFLLHRRAYSNHSLLVECFTPDEGRFPSIVRGTQGRKGTGAGWLQPFVPLLVQCTGRGDVRNLIRHEAAATPIGLQGRALYCGFYLNELIMRLTQRRDPQQQLFARYGESLDELARSEALEPVLRRFEIALLELLGYGLILDRESETGRALEPGRRYKYLVEAGPLPAPEGDRQAFRGSTLLGLYQQRSLDQGETREARRLLRGVLAFYLGDKPLKSRELFAPSTSEF